MKTLLSATLFSLLSAASAAQTTHRVPADFPTIRAAIAAAVDGDRVLVAPGTYYEYVLDFQGKGIELVSEDGADATTLKGLGNLLTFRSGEGADTIVSGFRILDARAEYPWTLGYLQSYYAAPAAKSGGGAYIVGSSPQIRDCVFEGCAAATGESPPSGYSAYYTIADAGNGGAIYIEGGSPIIERVEFRNNRAGEGKHGSWGWAGAGGVVGHFNGDFIWVPESDSENGDHGESGRAGGAGGAIYVDGGSPSILNCTFESNRAGHAGRGGNGGNGGNANLLITTGKNGGHGANGGRGGDGGAIAVAAGNPLISNCRFDGNEAGDGGRGGHGGWGGDGFYFLFGYTKPGGNGGNAGDGGRGGRGGAIHVDAGASADVLGCTLVRGSAGEAGKKGDAGAAGLGDPSGTGGGAADDGTPGTGGGIYGNADVSNTILWANGNEGLGGAPTLSFSCVEGGYSGTGVLATNPAFVSLSGGDLRLQETSPCIDAGDGDAVPAESTQDLDGRPRVFDNLIVADTGVGDPVDMGAYEQSRGFVLPYGCGTNPAGSLVHLDGLPELGGSVTLGVDNPLGSHALGSAAYLKLSLVNDAFSCGISLAGFGMDGGAGALEIDLGTSFSSIGPAIWLGPGNPAPISVAFPDKPKLVGVSFVAQGLMLDFLQGRVGLSESRELVVGP